MDLRLFLEANLLCFLFSRSRHIQLLIRFRISHHFFTPNTTCSLQCIYKRFNVCNTLLQDTLIAYIKMINAIIYRIFTYQLATLNMQKPSKMQIKASRGPKV